MAKSYKIIAAADATLRVLELMADQREAVSGQEVAAATGLAYGTAMCHLATLERRNFVDRVGDGYFLGPKVAYIWAKYITRLEAQRDRINHELKELEVKDGHRRSKSDGDGSDGHH